MTADTASVREIGGLMPDAIPPDVLVSDEPILLKGLVSTWPFVQAARRSADEADAYLRKYYQGATVGAFYGPPEGRGRVFYNEDLTGFAYQPLMVKLDQVLDKIREHRDDPVSPSIYVGSTTVDTCLPGFRDENDVDLGEFDALASIWLGNRTVVAAHFDVPDNLACCVAGRRRFTLFPPEQLPNLYVGPLDFSPGGQAISLVDLGQPDYERFPRFREALEHALVADMEPGDALLLPSMWWHHVQGLESLNVLINYWWRRSPAWMGTPADVLTHAILSLRELPRAQRDAWRGILEHYVFREDEDTAAHIPEYARGRLGPIDETTARKLRAELLNKLNR
jgi:hypothetical protein